MNETEFINRLSSVFRPAPKQINKPWEADAEIIEHSPGRFFAVSTDGFSETEDFFQSTPPERIGRNIAWGAAADLCACGVKPEFISQCWNIDTQKDIDYYIQLAHGIESTLKEMNIYSLGGDTGVSSPWNWTGTLWGQSASTPILRKAREETPFTLYATGSWGDANAAGAFGSPAPLFEIRRPIPPNSLFGTDSSGGFFDAIESFRRVNPRLTLNLNLDAVPYAVSIPFFPSEFLLIGGIGEYELLFALPQSAPAPEEGVAIGEGAFTGEGVTLLKNGRQAGKMNSSPPDYRNVAKEQYLEVTQKYYNELGLGN